MDAADGIVGTADAVRILVPTVVPCFVGRSDVIKSSTNVYCSLRPKVDRHTQKLFAPHSMLAECICVHIL